MLVYRIEHKYAKCGFFSAIHVLQMPEYRQYFSKNIEHIDKILKNYPHLPVDESMQLDVYDTYRKKYMHENDARFATKNIDDLMNIWTQRDGLLDLLHKCNFHLAIYEVLEEYTLTLITQIVFSCNKATMVDCIPITKLKSISNN